MKKILKVFYAFFVLLCACSFCFSSNIVCEAESKTDLDYDLLAKSYLVIEEQSEMVLYAKNETQRYPMASITKVQTLNVVFDEIANGNLKLTDGVTISEHSAKQKGSQAFLDEGKTYCVADLIKTVIINSANDSAVALAEKVSGTEQKFVEKMNKKAKSMGLENTNFENSTGLPVANHYSTAIDIAKMFKQLVKNEIYLKYSKIWMDELVHPSGRKTELVNTNRLLKTMTSCVAGKTGYTSEAGYCLVAKSAQNGMNLICVGLGFANSKERFDCVKTLFNLGFANFEKKQIVKAGDVFGEVVITKGKEKSVEVVANEDFYAIASKEKTATFELKVELFENKLAPVFEGESLGFVKIVDEKGRVIGQVNLVAKNSVEANSFGENFSRIVENW